MLEISDQYYNSDLFRQHDANIKSFFEKEIINILHLIMPDLKIFLADFSEDHSTVSFMNNHLKENITVRISTLTISEQWKKKLLTGNLYSLPKTTSEKIFAYTKPMMFFIIGLHKHLSLDSVFFIAYEYNFTKNQTEIINALVKGYEMHSNTLTNLSIQGNSITFFETLDSISDSIIITDSKCNILFHNKSADKIFNLNVLKTSSKSILSIIDSDYYALLESAILQRKKRKFEVYGRKNGSLIPISITFCPIYHDELYIFIFTDLSQIKQTISDLKLFQKKYNDLFHDLKEVIFEMDFNGSIKEINDSGLNLFGYTNEEILKLNFFTGICFDKKYKEIFHERVSQLGFVKDFPLKIKTKEGTILDSLLTASAVKSNDNYTAGFRGIIRDVTEIYEFEKKLIQKNIELEQMNYQLQQIQLNLIQREKMASIGELASGIAHEINNPLGFILSNFTTLNNYFDKLLPYLKEIENFCQRKRETDTPDYINSINNEISSLIQLHNKINIQHIQNDFSEIMKESKEGFDRILNIIQSLRNFSRIDYSEQITDYDLNEAIDNTLIIARNEIKYAAEIIKELNEIPLVQCIGGEVNQVLLNILVNAAQAIKEYKKEELGFIRIKTYADENNVYCSIEDNGSGIPSHLISKIFNPFFTTKEVGKGTGLGLAISYDIIVNKHGGNISVKSEQYKGTEFLIKLPIKFQKKIEILGD